MACLERGRSHGRPGSGQIGVSGRALLLAGSAYAGSGLKFKDGASAFFWVSDAMGMNALKNSKRIVRMLEDGGIRKIDEPEVIRGASPSHRPGPCGRPSSRGNVVWILAALPLAAMAVFFLIVMF